MKEEGEMGKRAQSQDASAQETGSHQQVTPTGHTDRFYYYKWVFGILHDSCSKLLSFIFLPQNQQLLRV